MHQTTLAALAAAWRDAGRVVALTGAGLSTASGIPDFRSPGGRWENYQPVTIQEFDHSHDAQVEYWRYKGETWRTIAAAEPNPGHRALAELGRADRLDLLVTQNVDGLHRRSGLPVERMITIHGTDSMVECRGCGRRNDRAPAQAVWESGVEVPTCADCGGALKPATISFGQSLVMSDLQRAFDAADGCDLFVAIGTSLVVSPINHMVSLAVRAGAGIAILTASETPFDSHATWRIDDPLEVVLPSLAEQILG
ncbi:MAG: Sir2 family NAD-dependent protein deacetylase [Acidobacteriota bacterium]